MSTLSRIRGPEPAPLALKGAPAHDNEPNCVACQQQSGNLDHENRIENKADNNAFAPLASLDCSITEQILSSNEQSPESSSGCMSTSDSTPTLTGYFEFDQLSDMIEDSLLEMTQFGCVSNSNKKSSQHKTTKSNLVPMSNLKQKQPSKSNQYNDIDSNCEQQNPTPENLNESNFNTNTIQRTRRQQNKKKLINNNNEPKTKSQSQQRSYLNHQEGTFKALTRTNKSSASVSQAPSLTRGGKRELPMTLVTPKRPQMGAGAGAGSVNSLNQMVDNEREPEKLSIGGITKINYDIDHNQHQKGPFSSRPFEVVTKSKSNTNFQANQIPLDRQTASRLSISESEIAIARKTNQIIMMNEGESPKQGDSMREIRSSRKGNGLKRITYNIYHYFFPQNNQDQPQQQQQQQATLMAHPLSQNDLDDDDVEPDTGASYIKSSQSDDVAICCHLPVRYAPKNDSHTLEHNHLVNMAANGGLKRESVGGHYTLRFKGQHQEVEPETLSSEKNQIKRASKKPIIGTQPARPTKLKLRDSIKVTNQRKQRRNTSRQSASGEPTTLMSQQQTREPRSHVSRTIHKSNNNNSNTNPNGGQQQECTTSQSFNDNNETSSSMIYQNGPTLTNQIIPSKQTKSVKFNMSKEGGPECVIIHSGYNNQITARRHQHDRTNNDNDYAMHYNGVSSFKSSGARRQPHRHDSNLQPAAPIIKSTRQQQQQQQIKDTNELVNGSADSTNFDPPTSSSNQSHSAACQTDSDQNLADLLAKYDRNSDLVVEISKKLSLNETIASPKSALD